MKKAVLKSSVLLSSLLVSSIAFGQAPEAKPEVKKDEIVKTIVPYGLIQAYTNLSDSERQNTPDFKTLHLRFGLKVSEGMLRGQFETAFMGNNTSSSVTKEGVVIRRAEVGLALPSSTTILFGRTRLGEANAWGMDQTYATDGYGGLDGVQIKQEITVSEGNTLGLRAGVGNAFSVPSSKEYAFATDSAKKEKTIIVGATANISGVKAAFIYGVEKNMISEAFASAVAAKPADTATGSPGVASVPAKGLSRDATHIEASLGYDLDNIGGGVWFERITLGAAKPITKIDGGKMTLGEAGTSDAAVEKTTDLWGIGMNGDSTLFGGSDFLQKGDKFVYGASYMGFSDRSKFKDDATSTATKKKDAEKEKDRAEYVVGAGYAIGGAVIELDVKISQSKAKQFANSKGEAGKSKTATSTHLIATYVF